MEVVFAYYGLSCAGGAISLHVQYVTTAWAAGLCDGNSACRGNVHTSVLGDPYYGCGKDFIVVAKCDSGQVIADSLAAEAQGQTFHLACN